MSNDPPHATAVRSTLANGLAWLARVVSGVQVRWIDCAPEARPRVYYANHSSHLDAVVLWASLPPHLRVLTRPVAAEDYWTAGKIRRYLATNVFRAVLIERGNPFGGRNGAPTERESAAVESAPAETSEASSPSRTEKAMERMVEAIGDRGSLILFPEGTRGSGERIGDFRSGLYHLALRRPDLELVPVYLENLNRILPKGEVLPVPILGRVYFGCPLRVADGEGKREFLARARAALERLRDTGGTA